MTAKPKSRDQDEWNFSCVESACYELMNTYHQSQELAKTVGVERVYRTAKGFDGFTESKDYVATRLSADDLDTVAVEAIDDGRYKISRDF